MAVVAPISKYKKNNLKIYIIACILFAVWLGYDGFFSESFRAKHTKDGVADSTLSLNRVAACVLAGAAVLLAGYFFAVKDKKVVAEDNELIIDGRKRIQYQAIQKVDKSFFEKKGFFTFVYKDEGGTESKLKISDRRYDNLSAVLDKLIEKIS
jgi:hypothetical protein